METTTLVGTCGPEGSTEGPRVLSHTLVISTLTPTLPYTNPTSSITLHHPSLPLPPTLCATILELGS